MPSSGALAPTPRRRAQAGLVLVVVAAVVAGAVGTYLGVGLLERHAIRSTAPGPTEIPLLPSATTRSSCIVGTPGTPRPTLALQFGTLQANTYSVPNGTVGHVGMCYNATAGSLFGYANWSHVGAAGGWFSYPQVAYGVNDYAGAGTTYTNQSSAWSLPQTVAATVRESLWVTASYSVEPPNSSDVSGYDLSFDDFFSQGLPPTLEVPPFVEVEIFLAHNISYPFSWLNWTTPTLVNATLAPEPWGVAYYCHGVDNGTNGNVSFDFSYGGPSTQGLRSGTLGVNLSAVLQEVESLLPGATCWTGPTHGFAGFYLGEEDLGSEDGAVGGSAFNYNWTVTRYCLHTLVDPRGTSAVACTGTDPPESARAAHGATSGTGSPGATVPEGSRSTDLRGSGAPPRDPGVVANLPTRELRATPRSDVRLARPWKRASDRSLRGRRRRLRPAAGGVATRSLRADAR